MAENTQGGNPICCSFCGKETGKVDRMIMGNGAYICDECILACLDIISDDIDLEVSPKRGGSKGNIRTASWFSADASRS